VSADPDALYHDLVDRVVAGTDSGGTDGVHHLAGIIVGDLAENRVLEVQPGSGGKRDEELRSVAGRSAVGHGQQVGAVELQLRVELVGKLVARPAQRAVARTSAERSAVNGAARSGRCARRSTAQWAADTVGASGPPGVLVLQFDFVI